MADISGLFSIQKTIILIMIIRIVIILIINIIGNTSIIINSIMFTILIAILLIRIMTSMNPMQTLLKPRWLKNVRC